MEIIKEYKKGNTIRCYVKTKYGVCDVLKAEIKRGKMPTIQSALDKNEYFRNQCLERFGKDEINDLSQIEYINSITKIKVIDKDFGEYYVTPSEYLVGTRNRERSYYNKRYSLKEVTKKITEIHNELKIVPNQEEQLFRYILIENKYGICKTNIAALLNGSKPSIITAIDKTSYFINQAKEVHGDKYDYYNVNYQGGLKPIEIINKKNGNKFLQKPHLHLLGHGCPVEGRENTIKHNRDNIPVWKHSDWEKAANRSKNFTGYKVYIIQLENDEESFLKIGKTFTNLNRRFGSKYNLPYKYELLYSKIFDDAKEASEYENYLKNKNKNGKYTPKIPFGGQHECFKEVHIPELNTLLTI